MDIEIHAVPSENTLSSIFSTLKHEGIDVIVGDAIAVEARAAKRHARFF